jgi:L-asparaginase II
VIIATRSGLVEAVHPVAAAATDAAGRVVASFGVDLDRDFFARSAIKPFQALVAQRSGARLASEELALAAASHGGQPAHVAIVRQMLLDGGLAEGDLMCPPARPGTGSADLRWAAAGRIGAERVFHNCSGKHAAVLRACAAGEWSMRYTDPRHPYNEEVVTIVEGSTGRSVRPLGVDGCGLPTLRTDVVALARGFAALVTDPRMRPETVAMARHGSLTSDGDRAEAVVARWAPFIVKAGAQGCVAAGWLEGDLGLAAKAWTGDGTAATVALVELMGRVGLLGDYQRRQLGSVASPPVLGGGVPVGSYEMASS